jgi:hypothetical protein
VLHRKALKENKEALFEGLNFRRNITKIKSSKSTDSELFTLYEYN